jgi:hypothetical protein
MVSIQVLAPFMIFNWSDVLEIFVISTGIYYISTWLGYDRQTHLLAAFYTYCLMTIGFYYAQLPTLTLLACLAAPVLLVIFFLIHSTTLQKNFIAMKKPISQQTISHAWLTECLRSALRIVNMEKPVFMLIENKDSMASFVTCQLPIHAPIHHKLLDLLLASSAYNPHAMIWLTTQGTLLGINATWTYELDTTWFDTATQQLETWKQNALFMTKKSDALFVYADPQQHMFTIIMHGVSYEKLRIEQVITLLSKQFSISPITLQSRETSHGSFQNKQSYTQHTT